MGNTSTKTEKPIASMPKAGKPSKDIQAYYYSNQKQQWVVGISLAQKTKFSKSK